MSAELVVTSLLAIDNIVGGGVEEQFESVLQLETGETIDETAP